MKRKRGAWILKDLYWHCPGHNSTTFRLILTKLFLFESALDLFFIPQKLGKNCSIFKKSQSKENFLNSRNYLGDKYLPTSVPVHMYIFYS